MPQPITVMCKSNRWMPWSILEFLYVHVSSIQEVIFCSPPPSQNSQKIHFLKTRRGGRKRKKNLLFFWNFHFLCVFFTFFVFFLGVLDHVLRPPCRRYGGDSFTKKVGNAKNQFTYFSVFRYLKLFGAHETSNVCIYFQQKLFYRHPVGDTEVTFPQKK